ncbi:L,D-transpeptidase family protein [Bernardetia sp.]|uniref:L,D-transpeptidase family protein n=1 Tax=Bernardetia sp. TaxID=1937974 RepID=UPI0025BC8378|nr:L,D-transpeptidase family protein [Bernardetia sp.]
MNYFPFYKRFFLLTFLLAFLFLTFSSCKRDKFGHTTEEIDIAYLIPEAEIDTEEAEIWIKQLIDAKQSELYFPDSFARSFLKEQLYLFYQKNNFQPVWYSATTVLPHTQSLMGYLKSAGSEGLNEDAYALADIDETQTALLGTDGDYDLPKLMKLDVFTTAMALTYLNHIKAGRVKPDEVGDELNIWLEDYHPADFVDVLYSATQNNTFDDIIKKAEPQYELYAKLKEAREEYKKIVREGGWEKINIENYKKIKIDSTEEFNRHELVPTIRNILSKTGDLQLTENDASDTSQVYDKKLQEAVKNFQERHTLERDGVVGNNLLKELATSAETRLEQIELNMERMRWLRDSLGDSYIIVNVPSYWMRLYDYGKRNFETKVMVGRSFHATPLFVDTMKYVVMSPKWHVPVSIATNEMLPKLRRGGSYFSRNNFSIYQRTSSGVREISPSSVNWSNVSNMGNYSIVQNSGAGNALGRVKFIFPNANNVYMHDTPSTQFDKADRALSHGCIRLHEPEALANYILKEKPETWTPEKIHETMYGGTTTNVYLDRQWVVHIVYWTTWVDDNGKVHFSKDVYGYDQAQKDILAKRDKNLEEWMQKRSKEFSVLKKNELAMK